VRVVGEMEAEREGEAERERWAEREGSVVVVV
jgi:hypothetical protein